jgi:hypothetical protein
MIAMLLLFGAGLVALHVKYPAAREAAQDFGSSFALVIFGVVIASRSWRERRTDMPSTLARLVIWIDAVVCTCIGILAPHRIIPWFLSPVAVMIVLFLAVAVSPRPQCARTD